MQDAMKSKNLYYTLAVCAFLAVIFVFCAFRAKHGLRWSALAYADAETLISSRHFVNEGFKKHYFMNYHTPGYLGYTTPNISKLGYDPHYPSLSETFDALIIRRFGENLYLLKVIAIVFSCLALLLLYGVLSHFFDRQVSALGTAFIALSISFLDHADAFNLYTYSETFRFAALFFFLRAEGRLKVRRIPAASLFFLATWTVTFLEGMNSNDYIVFIQLFFFLYYFFLRHQNKFPWGRMLFLASAPVTAGALRIYQNILALGGWEALMELTIRSPLSGGKTAPLDKGISSFFSFWTYFARTLENNMVTAHFGFGFAMVMLMAAFPLFFPKLWVDEAVRPSAQRGLTLRQTLLLLLIPSLSWWAIFPNHAASFFWMPKHIWPVLAALFGLTLSLTWKAFAKSDSSPAFKWAAGFIVAGSLWTHAISTGKYLKEYPNPISPQTRTQMGDWGELEQPDIIQRMEVFKAAGKMTSFGDILIVHDRFDYSPSFFAYQADRRVEFAKTPAELEDQVKKLREYGREGYKKFKFFGPVKLYALARPDMNSELWKILAARYPDRQTLPYSWVLFSLDPSSPRK